MNLLWCCLAAVFTVSSTTPVNVELTVRQVQSILRQNPQLPRLSRDDIIQLLDDIRAEDARTSREAKTSNEENKQNPETSKQENMTVADKFQETAQPVSEELELTDNEIPHRKPNDLDDKINTTVEETTNANDPSVMLVLPYTPRDGSTLQELYTKAPRTELVPASTLTTQSTERMKVASSEKMLETFTKNAKIANEARKQLDYPEFNDFLKSHGLSGKPGEDHFLLPLEGFKPLPPAKVIDGKVELPENIILTYDLISSKPTKNDNLSPSRVPFDPLHPAYEFELATAESENKDVVFPLDLPIKSVEDLDLLRNDQISVLPLHGGPNPANEESIGSGSELGKRQTAAPETSETASSDDNKETVTTSSSTTGQTVDEGFKVDLDNATSNKNAEPASDNSETSAADSGASISDLEDSFGGAVPSDPGDSQLPPPKKNGFYWMLDWNSFLEVGDGDTKVNIRFEPKLGDPQMFLPVSVP